MSWSEPKKPTNHPIFASGCSSVFLMWLNSGRSRDHSSPGLNACSTFRPGNHLWPFIYLSAELECSLSRWQTRVVKAKFTCDGKGPRVLQRWHQSPVWAVHEAVGCFHVVINLQGGTPRVLLMLENMRVCVFFHFKNAFFPHPRMLTMNLGL